MVEVVTGPEQCAAYENYAGAEPAGYAEFCVQSVPEPWVSENFDPTDTAFAQDIGFVSDNFVSHALNDFTGQAVIGPNAQTIFAMDFDQTGTILYAIDNTSRELGTYNLATGAFTAIATVSDIPVADNISGLTIDPATGTAYVSGLGTGLTLYTMNLTTAVATVIGSDATVTLMIDIAIGPQGIIYGHDIGTDNIYTIDKTTGVATVVGPTGVNPNFAQGMDFDNVDGTLYAYTYQGGGANQYGTINLATGALTPLAISNPQGEFEGATMTAGAGTSACGGGIPWASVAPSSGTTSGGNATDVTVTFDSTGLTIGNTYTGTLCIESNDAANPLVTVPLTLTVEAPSYGVEVVSGITLSGDPGTTVTHTLWITNTGDVLDTFNLSVTGNSWNTVLYPASVGLLPGDSTMVTAWVTIPAGVAGGAMDVVTVTATSQGDLGTSDSADVTTVANMVYSVQLGSTNMALTSNVGTVVTYSVWITNTGNTTDSYDIGISGIWTATTSITNVALSSGANAKIWVWVDIPVDAASGAMDVTTVTATSSGSGANDLIELTTTAVIDPAPSITLVKTVGTGAGSCATTTTITVTTGTTVYYCYEVTNTGNITLSLHDLDDDQLGSIMAGLVYDLAPGASVDTVAAGLTISATIMTDTVNTAIWTAYNAGPTNVVTATASATVNVEEAGPTMYYIYLPFVARGD
jgi:hypothetical protein